CSAWDSSPSTLF
nr:immunoglobulin light chain junction region [Macaca mulatta]